MEIHIIDQIAERQASSPQEFWRAFLIVFNYYILWEMRKFYAYPEGRRLPQEVIDAVQLLDCWRDIVYEEGWAWRKE